MQFDGYSAVITGGSSGIGRATAEAFADQGAKVAILGRTVESEAATSADGRIMGIQGDVSNFEDMCEFFEQVAAKHGKIDVLLANAGIAEFVPIEAADPAHFRRLTEVNYLGTVNTLLAALPHLSDNASVILTTSIANRMGEPFSSGYAASKSAVRALIGPVSTELVSKGIRVNAISPGPTETPIFQKMGLNDEAFAQTREKLAGSIPAGRMGQVSDMTNAVLFLASKESGFIVGQELVVDGGITGCAKIA